MDIENEIQLIFTKIYGVKVMNNAETDKKDGETDKTNKFDLIPYEEFLKIKADYVELWLNQNRYIFNSQLDSDDI